MKAGFSRLLTEWDLPQRRYVLIQPLIYTRPSGAQIKVPAGFSWDGDSVPRIPVAYWLLKGRAQAAATIHDWLYYSQAGKAFADQVFLEAMEIEGLSRWTRYPIYWGVVIGGHAAYDHHSNKYVTS